MIDPDEFRVRVLFHVQEEKITTEFKKLKTKD